MPPQRPGRVPSPVSPPVPSPLLRLPASSLPAAALLLLALAPGAVAHGEYEASELEVHLLSDEGSDAIEPYGGYDIQDLFLGFAHDPAVGEGAAGDGFYLRAEIYGLPENSVQPPGTVWSVVFHIGRPDGELTRTLATTDGVTFEHDFDALLVEVEPAERSTHVNRAFVSFASAGLQPGQPIGPFRVESFAGSDLRDHAPGGIPVPGSGGAAEYPDPTQIDGEGELVTTVALAPPTGYAAVQATADAPGLYTVTVSSLLDEGAQHVVVVPRATDGWQLSLEGETNKAVDPGNRTATFRILATPSPGAAPLEVDVTTDVGGRTPLQLLANGTLLLPDGTGVTPAPMPPKESPGIGALPAALGLVAFAAARRRRRTGSG